MVGDFHSVVVSWTTALGSPGGRLGNPDGGHCPLYWELHKVKDEVTMELAKEIKDMVGE